MVNDEYLNLFIQLNDGQKIKNIVKGGRLININDKNKDKIRNILNKRLQIIKSISDAQGKVARKQKQIEPLQQLVNKVDNVSKVLKGTIKAIKTSKSIKAIQNKVKQFLEKRRIEKQAKIKDEVVVRSIKDKKFYKVNYKTENVNNLQEYFNLIFQKVLEGGYKIKETNEYIPVKFILIPFKENNAGEDEDPFYWRSIDVSVIYGGFEGFNNRVNDITTRLENGRSVSGSDGINMNEYYIDLTLFTTINSLSEAEGKSDDLLFKVKGINNKDGYCVSECLKECGIDVLELGLREKDFKDMFYLINFIERNNLDIAIVCNAIELKTPFNIMFKSGRKTEKIVIEKKKNGVEYKHNYVCFLLNNDDIKTKYITGNKDSKYKILYDEVNKHCDIIEGDIKIEDNVYITAGSDVIKNGKIIFTTHQLNVNFNSLKPIPIEYLFFDYETVIDFNSDSCMKPYSLSILRLNKEQLELLDNYDEAGNLEKVNEIRKSNCITFMGYDCNKRFIDWILQNESNKSFVFIGFNNSNFDNFLLLSGLLDYKGTNEVNVSEIFYNGNQLLNFITNGTHTTFDIRKHLLGSLKDNCESFKIKCCSKKSFDHDKAQQLHEKNELLNFINNNEELKEYNEFDVLATAVLYKRYVNALNLIPSTSKYADKLFETKTIGSLIYKVFTDSKNKKDFKLPKLTYEQYSNLQSSKIAGRVEMFNGVQKVEERLVSTDVCSLYPYCMAVNKVYYPCGDIKDVDSYQGDDTIGFYYCDIDQSNLRKMNLPNIYAEKTGIENIWNSDKPIMNYLISNVMIKLLKKYGCSVSIRNGFIFTDKMKSCEMFDFILDLMKAKNQQDMNKDSKDPEIKKLYNPALRETLKLLMNSLSGKVIEGLHTEKTVAVDTTYEYIKRIKGKKSVNCINIIGRKIFITYEEEEEKLIKQQRPIYLGVLIYDYAKTYMYENSYSKIGLDKLLYTDTDASKFRYKDFINWKNWVDSNNIQVPHWEEVELVDERYNNHKIYEENSKVFGAFEDELKDLKGEAYTFYCLEKKTWCYSVANKNHDNKPDKFEKKKDGTIIEIKGDLKTETKYRFKGLNGNAIILNLEEDIVEEQIKKDGTINYKLIEDKRKVYNFYNNNKEKNLDNNTLKFYEKLYSTKNANVLASSFRKIVKNSLRNVKVDETGKFNNLINNIQMNFMIKQLNLK